MGTRSIPVAFGKVLRESRTKAGLTQERLALDAEIDPTYISLLERGLRQPTLDVLFRLGRVLGVSAATLVSRTAAIMEG